MLLLSFTRRVETLSPFGLLLLVPRRGFSVPDMRGWLSRAFVAGPIALVLSRPAGTHPYNSQRAGPYLISRAARMAQDEREGLR